MLKKQVELPNIINNKIDHFQGNHKIPSISCASCMVIDCLQRRFVMNMQLRQCFSRSKPVRLKKKPEKARFCLAFFDFQKKSKMIKQGQNFKIWFQKSQIGNPGAQFAHLRSFACRGRMRNMIADYCNLCLYGVTITLQ